MKNATQNFTKNYHGLKRVLVIFVLYLVGIQRLKDHHLIQEIIVNVAKKLLEEKVKLLYVNYVYSKKLKLN